MRLRGLILVAAAAAFPCSAQQASWDYIGGGFGASDFHVSDAHASPMIFSAWGIAPTLQFIHAGERIRHYAEASFYSARLSTGLDNFRTDDWRGRGRYAFLLSVADFGEQDRPFRLFLGGSLNSFVSRSHYYYFITPLNGYGSSIDTWYWSHSLDVALHLEYGFAEREFLFLQLYVPLLSNVSRPQYSPGGDYSYTENVWKMNVFGRTEVFPKNVSCDLLLSFQVPLAWKFNIQFSYEFYFASYDLPRDVRMYMNNARAGLFFCF